MPVISTNDPTLHLQLKRKLIGSDLTIGRAIEKFTRFGLEFDVLTMSDEQIKNLKSFLKSQDAQTLPEFVESVSDN